MKKQMTSLFVALCLGVPTVTTFVGCSSNNSGSRSTGQYIDDKSLTSRVKGALDDNPLYKFEHVKVDTYKGTVQLSGFVNTSTQKTEAGRIAKTVEGVHEVENNISLRP
jgi:osmotically-inducible protein OsmY